MYPAKINEKSDEKTIQRLGKFDVSSCDNDIAENVLRFLYAAVVTTRVQLHLQ